MSSFRQRTTLDSDYTMQVTARSPHTQIILAQLFFAMDILLITLLVCATLFLDCVYFSQPLNETSYTELSQQLLLVIASGCFLQYALSGNALNRASLLLAAFFSVLLVRELDHWFDYISHGAWIYPALLIAVSAIWLFVKDMPGSSRSLGELLNKRAASILIVGLVLLLIFSRLAGMGKFWQLVMDESYLRQVKTIVEEGTELLAYYLIAFASFKMTK